MTAAGAARKKLREPGPFGVPVRIPLNRSAVETYAEHGSDQGFWTAVLNRVDEGDIVLTGEAG